MCCNLDISKYETYYNFYKSISLFKTIIFYMYDK